MTLEELIAAMEKTAAAPKLRKIQVKEWGELHIRDLTLAEVEEQDADTANKNDKRAMARAAIRVICNGDGKRMFDPANDKHVTLIASQPWRLIRLALADEPPKT